MSAQKGLAAIGSSLGPAHLRAFSRDPATGLSPQTRADHGADSPRAGVGGGRGSPGLGVRACVWVRVDARTPPVARARLQPRARGGSLEPRPGMICRCLMRLMSPGGWYAAALGLSLDADAHGNGGGRAGGCGSPARWFPLICGRGRGRRPGAGLPHPPPYSPTPCPPGSRRRRGTRRRGCPRAPAGRLMGPGTALLLAAVGPRPGTGYVLHKYLLDEVRDKRGPGHGGGREPRTVWVFLLDPRTSPSPPTPSPRHPLYLRGCRAHSAASPPHPPFLRNPESPGGPEGAALRPPNL